MRAAAAPLAAFEVAIAGGSATLAGSENVFVHAQAHGATGLTPLESGGAEDFVDALGFSFALHRLRAGDDESAHAVMHFVAVDHARCGAQIFNTRVGAGADENDINRNLL